MATPTATHYLRFIILALGGLLSAFRAAPGASTRETREVPAFAAVLLGTSARVVVRQGSPQRVVVEASAEDLAKLQTEVVNGQLRIQTAQRSTEIGKTKFWIRNEHLAGSVTVYVTLPVVRRLSVSSSGYLQADTVRAQQLQLAVSGSGKLLVGQLQATRVKAGLSSSGQVAITQLRADTLQAAVSGSGGLTATGACTYASLGLSSSGHVDTERLAVASCQVRISGSGSCRVHVTQTLDARISSSGTVLVSGNPQISKQITGSGRVRMRQ